MPTGWVAMQLQPPPPLQSRRRCSPRRRRRPRRRRCQLLGLLLPLPLSCTPPQLRLGHVAMEVRLRPVAILYNRLEVLQPRSSHCAAQHHVGGAQVLLPLPCRPPRLTAASPPSPDVLVLAVRSSRFLLAGWNAGHAAAVVGVVSWCQVLCLPGARGCSCGRVGLSVR